MDGQQQLRDQLHDDDQDDGDWRGRAGCMGADVDDFYGVITVLVQRVCARCHVRGECLTAALAEERQDGLSHGFRGGLTAGERRRMIVESGAVAA